MKVKLKDKGVKLPNMWKSCGVDYKDWEELHNGKEIQIKNLHESIENLVDVISPRKKGDK